MKYLKLFLTLIFVAFGAVVYLGNRDWMNGEMVLNLNRVPFYEIAPVYTKAGIAVAAGFLLGMIFALIHSSLNWIELMQSRRKIRRLEGEAEDKKEE